MHFKKYKGIYIGLGLVFIILLLYFVLHGRFNKSISRLLLLFSHWFGISFYLVLFSLVQSLFFKLAFSELKKVEFGIIFSNIFPVMVFFMFFHFPFQKFWREMVIILSFVLPVFGAILSFFFLSRTFVFRFNPGLNLKTLRRFVFIVPGLLVGLPNGIVLLKLSSFIVKTNLEWLRYIHGT